MWSRGPALEIEWWRRLARARSFCVVTSNTAFRVGAADMLSRRASQRVGVLLAATAFAASFATAGQRSDVSVSVTTGTSQVTARSVHRQQKWGRDNDVITAPLNGTIVVVVARVTAPIAKPEPSACLSGPFVLRDAEGTSHISHVLAFCKRLETAGVWAWQVQIPFSFSKPVDLAALVIRGGDEIDLGTLAFSRGPSPKRDPDPKRVGSPPKQ